jgi:hypothetical protein
MTDLAAFIIVTVGLPDPQRVVLKRTPPARTLHRSRMSISASLAGSVSSGEELRQQRRLVVLPLASARQSKALQSRNDPVGSFGGQTRESPNNAGTEGEPGPVTEQTTESYAATFETNVLGTLLSMKHAVEGLTQSAALEGAGSGVCVNVVAPGPIDTGMPTRFTGT